VDESALLEVAVDEEVELLGSEGERGGGPDGQRRMLLPLLLRLRQGRGGRVGAVPWQPLAAAAAAPPLEVGAVEGVVLLVVIVVGSAVVVVRRRRGGGVVARQQELPLPRRRRLSVLDRRLVTAPLAARASASATAAAAAAVGVAVVDVDVRAAVAVGTMVRGHIITSGGFSGVSMIPRHLGVGGGRLPSLHLPVDGPLFGVGRPGAGAGHYTSRGQVSLRSAYAPSYSATVLY